MKKLSINIPEGLGDVLSQEELKHVLGGMGSYGSMTGSNLGSEDKSRCNYSCSSHADCGGHCTHCATAPNLGGLYYCFASPPADPTEEKN